jgi:hypothetical protein
MAPVVRGKMPKFEMSTGRVAVRQGFGPLRPGIGTRPPAVRRKARGVVGAAAAAWIEGLEARCLFTTVLPATADADVENSQSNTAAAGENFGGDTTLSVGANSADTFVTYLKFDISSIQSVGGAFITLTGGESVPGDGANSISVFGVSDTSWTEGAGTHAAPETIPGEISFNNNPSISAVDGAGAEFEHI